MFFISSQETVFNHELPAAILHKIQLMHSNNPSEINIKCRSYTFLLLCLVSIYKKFGINSFVLQQRRDQTNVLAPYVTVYSIKVVASINV